MKKIIFKKTNIILENFKENYVFNFLISLIAATYFIILFVFFKYDKDAMTILNLNIYFISFFFTFDAIIFGIKIFKNNYFFGKQIFYYFSGASKNKILNANLLSVLIYFIQKYLISCILCIIILISRGYSNYVLECLNVISCVLLNNFLIFTFILWILFKNEFLFFKIKKIMKVYLFLLIPLLLFLTVYLKTNDSNICLLIFMRCLELLPFLGVSYAASEENILIYKVFCYMVSLVGILIFLYFIYKKNF